VAVSPALILIMVISIMLPIVLVCHCLRVFDKVIRECARGGARTPDDVAARCGAGTGCGGCRESIAAIVACESKGGPGVARSFDASDDDIAA
jgi:bacterioferritin-associated ferredoxin